MIQMRDGAPSAEDDAPSCPESEASRSYVTIRNGDALDELRKIPDASIDAIVTDPPYGLAEHKPERIALALSTWLGGDREHVPDGRGGFMGRSWDAFVPPPAAWDECLRVLKPGGFLACFAAPRTMDLMGLSIRLAGFEIRDGIGTASLMAWVQGSGFPKSKSQLKPAWEPIILARKPFRGSESANVLAHGTGALNIDGTRVGPPEDKRAAGTKAYQRFDPGSPSKGVQAAPHDGLGRWPANAIFSHGPDCADVCTPGCPVAELDAQSGTLKTGGGRRNSPKDAGTYGAFAGDEAPRSFEANEGGASRFFPVFRYQAKAPRSERPSYVDANGVKIKHETVKPLELMRWLVRLVTPPGGTVLDPFAGSGTTLQAAREEGFTSIGIEREPTYLPLIAHRLGVEVAEIIDPLLATIGAAPDRDTLLALWRAHRDTWTPEHDEAVRDRLSEIESAA